MISGWQGLGHREGCAGGAQKVFWAADLLHVQLWKEDTCQHASVQAPRVYTKNEPSCK